MTTISFVVRGTPVPQGSARAFVVNGHAVITSANKNLKSWRLLVSAEAQRYAPTPIWSCPVVVSVTFLLTRPKSHPKRKVTWPTSRPDLDKLIRAILDGLTGIIFADDSQVIGLEAKKAWGDPGAYIVVKQAYEIQEQGVLPMVV